MNSSIIGYGRVKSTRSLWRSEMDFVALRSDKLSHNDSASRGLSAAMSLLMSSRFSPSYARERIRSMCSVRVLLSLCRGGIIDVDVLKRHSNPLHQAEAGLGDVILGRPVTAMQVSSSTEFLDRFGQLQSARPLLVGRISVLFHVKQNQAIIEAQPKTVR